MGEKEDSRFPSRRIVQKIGSRIIPWDVPLIFIAERWQQTVNNNSSRNTGIGLSGLLGVAFVILKLTHVIDWSWWWATAPFWAPIVLGLIIIVVGFIVAIFEGRKG